MGIEFLVRARLGGLRALRDNVNDEAPPAKRELCVVAIERACLELENVLAMLVAEADTDRPPPMNDDTLELHRALRDAEAAGHTELADSLLRAIEGRARARLETQAQPTPLSELVVGDGYTIAPARRASK